MNVTFKESVHRILDRIKNEPYYQWPNKMGVTHQGGIRIFTVLTIEIGAYHQTMQGVKRSFRAISKGEVFERVCSRPEKSGNRAGYLASGESAPTFIGSDRGHPHSFKGYPGVQEERGTGHGADNRLLR